MWKAPASVLTAAVPRRRIELWVCLGKAIHMPQKDGSRLNIRLLLLNLGYGDGIPQSFSSTQLKVVFRSLCEAAQLPSLL